MSSFRKAAKHSVDGPDAKILGVKPWLSGLGLVSTGHKQLDEIMGGGRELGSLTVIFSDNHSDYANTLYQYELVEALTMQHPLMLLCHEGCDIDECVAQLPLNLTLCNKLNPDDASNSQASTTTSELSIAWQYSKYFSPETNPVLGSTVKGSQTPIAPVENNSSKDLTKLFCCSYDLSKRLQPSILAMSKINLIAYDGPDLGSSLDSISTAVSVFAQAHCKTIGRIFLPNLESLLIFGSSNEFDVSNTVRQSQQLQSTMIARFLLRLKHITRGTKLSVTTTVNRSAICPSLSHNFAIIADTVLEVQSFAGRNSAVPAEFAEFTGFLHVHKLVQIGVVAPFRPASCRYGLKRDRRKLHVQPLHLPPENSRSFGAAGTDDRLEKRAALSSSSSSSSSSSTHSLVKNVSLSMTELHVTSSAAAAAAATGDRPLALSGGPPPDSELTLSMSAMLPPALSSLSSSSSAACSSESSSLCAEGSSGSGSVYKHVAGQLQLQAQKKAGIGAAFAAARLARQASSSNNNSATQPHVTVELDSANSARPVRGPGSMCGGASPGGSSLDF